MKQNSVHNSRRQKSVVASTRQKGGLSLRAKRGFTSGIGGALPHVRLSLSPSTATLSWLICVESFENELRSFSI